MMIDSSESSTMSVSMLMQLADTSLGEFIAMDWSTGWDTGQKAQLSLERLAIANEDLLQIQNYDHETCLLSSVQRNSHPKESHFLIVLSALQQFARKRPQVSVITPVWLVWLVSDKYCPCQSGPVEVKESIERKVSNTKFRHVQTASILVMTIQTATSVQNTMSDCVSLDTIPSKLRSASSRRTLSRDAWWRVWQVSHRTGWTLSASKWGLNQMRTTRQESAISDSSNPPLWRLCSEGFHFWEFIQRHVLSGSEPRWEHHEEILPSTREAL